MVWYHTRKKALKIAIGIAIFEPALPPPTPSEGGEPA